MKRLQAYRFQLIPSGEQKRRMGCFAGSCRYVFNKALALQKQHFESGEKRLGYASLCRMLTEWRNAAETIWLRESPTHPLQQALKDLERGYANFFAKRSEHPRFKKKGQRDAFRYPDPKQIKLEQANNRVFLPKLGWVRYRNSREVLGDVRNATVSRQNGRWFISIQTEREVDVPEANGGALGIDVGVARFATFSDGKFVEPRNSFRQNEEALAKAQRALSRKKKFSNNWKKAKMKVCRVHAHVSSVRNDFLHKLSAEISKNHAIVCVEDLQVGNMSKSARGTCEAPGENVRAKSGLNKSILDQGWYEFRRQLDYKLAWNGGRLIAVPPRNTSRKCPVCSCVSSDNRPSQSEFHCVDCGFEENADFVGAINILRAGLACATKA
jgi:putative transposase